VLKNKVQFWIGICCLLAAFGFGWALTPFGQYIFNSVGVRPVVFLLPLVIVLVGILVIVSQLLNAYHKRKFLQQRHQDISAYLHDSVLQTLALIQNNSVDSALVRKLAKEQERDLRSWLYAKDRKITQSLCLQLELVVRSVEEERGVEIEFVPVGDILPKQLGQAKTSALITATTQALVNATCHGKPKYSVYLEIHSQSAPQIQLYIKDEGDGFDLDKIPNNRHGVKHSIIGSIQAVGGTVTVISEKGFGTEICIAL
jgi:signal transduction histidine kinase